jgi:hypothetical protein
MAPWLHSNVTCTWTFNKKEREEENCQLKFTPTIFSHFMSFFRKKIVLVSVQADENGIKWTSFGVIEEEF